MKKMAFGIIFILVLIVFVFAGCLSFSTPGIDVDQAEEAASLEEYETIIAASMDVPLTNAAGEQETNAVGEALTTNILVEEVTVEVTDASGEAVTSASGEKATTKVYVDPKTNKVVNNNIGDVKTTQVYKDKKTGEIVATTVPSTTNAQGNNSSGKTDTPTAPATTAPAAPQDANANEFEYLRSGNFYIQGVMTDASGESLPLEMAVTPNSIYMLSDFEGASMGMLISNGTTYMMYPAEKAYLELSDAILKMMGMDSGDLLSSSELDYSQYVLANADSTAKENVNGAECTVYIYNNDSGSTRFFMNGNKLVRFATYTANGTPDTVNDITMITNNVPADKINPPADYKAYKGVTGMFSFMSLLGDIME